MTPTTPTSPTMPSPATSRFALMSNDPLPALDDDTVLTEPETRKRVRLSKATLIRMRQSPDLGGLPFIQLSPGRIGYLWGDVKTYILARRVTSYGDATSKAA
jgi:hypothetical protein